ncbi:MAG: chemotaxis protein CheW [Phycisphaerae bacterium]|nr:chemotaxis protein CheW [Phycisphaerae bacterium]
MTRTPVNERSEVLVEECVLRPRRLTPQREALLDALAAELDSLSKALSAGTTAEVAAALLPTADYFGDARLITIAHQLASLESNACSEASATVTRATEQLRRMAEETRSDAAHAAESLDGTLAADPRAAAANAPHFAGSATLGIGSAAPVRAAKSDVGLTTEETSRSNGFGSLVPVQAERLDAILTHACALVQARNRLLAFTGDQRSFGLPGAVLDSLRSLAREIDHATSGLQASVLHARRQPLSRLFERCRAALHDSGIPGRGRTTLEFVGGEIEIDHRRLDSLHDPILQLLRELISTRNSPPAVQRARDTNSSTHIQMSASSQGGYLRIALCVDPVSGEERPTCHDPVGSRESSTGRAADNSFVSARLSQGAEWFRDLGWTVAAPLSRGRCSTIEMRTPLNDTIISAVVADVGSRRVAIPLLSIAEIVRLEGASLCEIQGQPHVGFRGGVVPLVRLDDGTDESPNTEPGRYAVVVSDAERLVALSVDHLIGKREIVVMPLCDAGVSEGHYAAATELEDGEMALIIDAGGLLQRSRKHDGAAP